MTQLFANNAKGKLNANLTNTATTLTLVTGNGAKFPAITGADYFLATLFEYGADGEQNHEIVRVSARSGDTFTIVRAQEGTTARAWGSGTPVELRVTRDTLNDFHTDGENADFNAVTASSLILKETRLT